MSLLVIAGYLLGIALLTRHFSRQRSSTKDYFARGRRIPTWVIAGSIAATETSAVTFISIPAISYARGGNLELLQLALGYVVGRLVISVIFIPGYFAESCRACMNFSARVSAHTADARPRRFSSACGRSAMRSGWCSRRR